MELQGPLKCWTDIGRSNVTTSQNTAHGAAATVCPNCQTPFGVLIHLVSTTIQGLFNNGSTDATDAALSGGSLFTIPLNPDGIDAYKAVPALIIETFSYILEDARRRRNAAGIMSGSRSCLDVALKELGETNGGRRERINNLATRGTITTAIAAWAQTLWEEGSDATHDLQANIDRAIEHVEFLKLFFEVAFEMPAKVAASSHGAIGPT
jgi:hypothetical protein